LFAGYTGVEPNIVEEPLDQLMQQLIQGDIDAVLSRPRTGITESDAYFEGSPLATVSTTLPAHGGFICLPNNFRKLKNSQKLTTGAFSYHYVHNINGCTINAGPSLRKNSARESFPKTNLKSSLFAITMLFHWLPNRWIYAFKTYSGKPVLEQSVVMASFVFINARKMMK